MSRTATYKIILLLIVAAFFSADNNQAYAQSSINDTIVSAAVIYNGDTIEAKTFQDLLIRSWYDEAHMKAIAKWTRLRNAVYVTYPYARRAGKIMNELNARLVNISDKGERKKCIRSREKELKKEFTDPLTNLSVYQGKVLMKLINRETGNNCYEIIKEYKGAFDARFYQTIAFFFGSSLKQAYDRSGDDADMEKIVQEVERMYGFRG
ncbi:MAG: hypothetical protein JWR61_3214 [Ferruginibacter sp.]|uniref:DUF4294 domain-containing protein n=1 Tax=Ferruginibacter sp. TaxID=1940288 RepID=UPI002657E838|nr:DUF4294 domain-containing protein [Ferruginibacter sp.]MDB5278259.1 hypothetical protein [Ferruginibacter sp.]